MKAPIVIKNIYLGDSYTLTTGTSIMISSSPTPIDPIDEAIYDMYAQGYILQNHIDVGLTKKLIFVLDPTKLGKVLYE